MRTLRLALPFLALLIVSLLSAQGGDPGKLRVLLMGDSTTIGGKPVFGPSIEAIFAAQPDLPAIEVINVGRGGETAHSLMADGRYDRDISHLGRMDYIFFRYGINDWFHRTPVEEHFRDDVRLVLSRLRSDFPAARIVLMTIIPFLDTAQSEQVNAYIRELAKEEQLDLFDIHDPYAAKIAELSHNAMTVRFFPLSEVPERYHLLVKPYTRYYEWKKAEWVNVQSSELDPVLGHLDGWYKDKHPNDTGYRFLADQTANYLRNLILEHE